MKNYGMRWVSLDDRKQTAAALEKIGSDPAGVQVMAGKAVSRAIKMERVPLRAAHILKQSMLSLGGDVAVHRNVIVGTVEETDLLMMGSLKQYEKLVVKLAAQPFGLKEIGLQLKAMLAHLETPAFRTLNCRGRILTLGERTLIMGILNITPDSFSDGGRYFDLDRALAQAKRLVEEGADILDRAGPGIRKLAVKKNGHGWNQCLRYSPGSYPSLFHWTQQRLRSLPGDWRQGPISLTIFGVCREILTWLK